MLPGKVFPFILCPFLPTGRQAPRPKVRGLRGTCRSTRFHYFRCLNPLRALGNLKLHLFPCPQGSKTVTRNAAVMNKNVITTGLLNKAVSLFRVEPLHKSLSQNQLPPFQSPSCVCRWSPTSKRVVPFDRPCGATSRSKDGEFFPRPKPWFSAAGMTCLHGTDFC